MILIVNQIYLYPKDAFRYDNYLAVGYDLRNAGGELTKILLNCDIDVNQFSLFLSEVVLTVSSFETICFFNVSKIIFILILVYMKACAFCNEVSQSIKIMKSV